MADIFRAIRTQLDAISITLPSIADIDKHLFQSGKELSSNNNTEDSRVVAKELCTFIRFASGSNKALLDLLYGIENAPKAIRRLTEELSDLSRILQSLAEIISNNTEWFSILKLPLIRCGDACREFKAII